jgi:hypothetical protein
MLPTNPPSPPTPIITSARQERKGKGVLQYVRVCILGIKYVVYVLFYLLFLWLLCLYGYACVCGHFSHLEKGIYPSFESGKKSEYNSCLN